MTTVSNFGSSIIKFLVIAGIILAFATGFIPIAFLKAIPIWVWVIGIVIMIYRLVK